MGRGSGWYAMLDWLIKGHWEGVEESFRGRYLWEVEEQEGGWER